MRNRRVSERIAMKLPCMIAFGSPEASVPGVTLNMHRDGILIRCVRADLPAELPAVGSACTVQVELPPNPLFTQKCIICETTLVRVDSGAGVGEIHFAVRIGNVSFRDLRLGTVHFSAMKEFATNLPV